jgi:hypothetical protein
MSLLGHQASLRLVSKALMFPSGWALQRSLEAALALEALPMALTQRRPRPGLVHHSDRGVQYAACDYTAQLKQYGIRISMSRRATPYDNAQAERKAAQTAGGMEVGCSSFSGANGRADLYCFTAVPLTLATSVSTA